MVLLTPFQQGLKFGVEMEPVISIIVKMNTESIALQGPSNTDRDFPALPTPGLPTAEQSGTSQPAAEPTTDTENDLSNHDVLYQAFPKPLLLLFAPNTTTTTHPVHGECIFLTGVGAFAYQAVFDWIIACQTDKKEIPFYNGKELPYFKASRSLIAARNIDSPEAISAVTSRMKQLEYDMKFVGDLKVVYANNPSKELKRRIGKQIAAVRNFKWFVSYEYRIDELRQSIVALDNDVKAAVAARAGAK